MTDAGTSRRPQPAGGDAGEWRRHCALRRAGHRAGAGAAAAADGTVPVRSAANCWFPCRTAFRAAASNSTGVFMPSSRTSPARPCRSMATGSRGPGAWRGQSATAVELIARSWRDRPLSLRGEHRLRAAGWRAERDAHGREPGADPRCPTASASIPGSRGMPARAAGEGRARLARGRAPSADRRRRRSPRIRPGTFPRRCAARRLDQQWLRRLGRQRAIVQPEDGIALSVQASPLLDVFILYSPSPDAGFFCFEPVSHPVDAHHGEGLTVLDRAKA